MKDNHRLEERPSPSPGEPPTPAVAPGELYRWFAPWISGSLLVLVALLGLFTASAAQGPAGFDAGLLTFGLAIIALARGLKNYFDGISTALWSPILVADTDSLLLLVLLLVGLAILGLILASRAQDPVWQDIGYALFCAGIVMIAGNLKHYFDCRESQNQGDPRSTG